LPKGGYIESTFRINQDPITHITEIVQAKYCELYFSILET